MNVVDSSAWLEYFTNGPNAGYFAPAIEDTKKLVVPTISIYEVFKKVLQDRGEGDALKAVAQMKQGRVCELDERLALNAARLSQRRKLPLADSVILATAHAHSATLWTQDEHFRGLKDVNFKARTKTVA